MPAVARSEASSIGYCGKFAAAVMRHGATRALEPLGTVDAAHPVCLRSKRIRQYEHGGIVFQSSIPTHP